MIPNRTISTAEISTEVDKMISAYSQQRKNFERRWYDNNFFDDGFHYRYMSRTTNRVVDMSDKGIANMPTRAIPKASRQIRGIANLLLGPEFVPVVYPEKVVQSSYPDPQLYQQSYEKMKMVAKQNGLWLQNEWKEQELFEKLTYMVILACKHGISFMQVWQDPIEEKIRTKVFDAFDIYTLGNLTSIYESPSIIKTIPTTIEEIKANENFNPEQVEKLAVDNKYASSEVKNSYLLSRYGGSGGKDATPTIILKEAFIKEYIKEDNIEDLMATFPQIMQNKKVGDMIMRHSFTAGGTWLRDEYVDLKEYPFVDLRLEPGLIYQTPLIERFIPTNKSLDIVVSRIERWANTMVAGIWTKRKGEDFAITNIPGGQVVEYKTTPPIQANMASVPPSIFELISFLNGVIEEQGASTSTLGVLPTGVKSGVAIESLKSTEYANLKIASDMLKLTVKRISEKMFEVASQFVNPSTVYQLDSKSEPNYFDVIGQAGVDVRKQMGEDIVGKGFIPIKGDTKVDIEVESGLGFTMEGRKQTMQQIVTFMQGLAQQGLVTQDALMVVVNKLLETYQFGATQDFMDAMQSSTQTTPLTQDQINQMKVAIVQVLQDTGILPQQQGQPQPQEQPVQEQPIPMENMPA